MDIMAQEDKAVKIAVLCPTRTKGEGGVSGGALPPGSTLARMIAARRHADELDEGDDEGDDERTKGTASLLASALTPARSLSLQNLHTACYPRH